MTPIQLANLALHKIGVTQGVEALDDATREAYTAGLTYDHRLRVALRRFPWPFATKYRASREDRDTDQTLYLVSGPLWETDPDELTSVQAWTSGDTYQRGDVMRLEGVNYYCILGHVASDDNAPPSVNWSTLEANNPQRTNGDWTYAYRWPEDCVFIRRIVPYGDNGRQFNPTPSEFRIGRDVNGLLMYTNVQEVEIEYTMLDCDHLWTDDLFLDAFTWALAAEFAPGLSRNGLTQTDCLQKFEFSIQIAQSGSNREQQQHPDGDAVWIRNR